MNSSKKDFVSIDEYPVPKGSRVFFYPRLGEGGLQLAVAVAAGNGS
ncbi:MAG: hypothetical protein ACKVU0_19640 [Saprospiraceae bacterium]